MQITPALVRYRLKGLKTDQNGFVLVPNRILAKVSRPEIAEFFLSPAPQNIVLQLKSDGIITSEEAQLSTQVPMADDLIVEADSGGHTDQGNAYTLMPAMIKLRDGLMERYKYKKKIRVGAAGGIGTPEAAAAAFIMGADFLLTGSINQCTVEAGTSDCVKDLLQDINVQDTAYAPAGDMFELGAKIQVLKKGVFFPSRANKLYDLYKMHNSLNELDAQTKKQLQDKYFKKSFEEIFNDCKAFYQDYEIDKAQLNPKYKMAMIFKWYFGLTTRLALTGDTERRVDWQIHTGSALGAFNQWVKGTELENWRARHVDKIAEKLIHETAKILTLRIHQLFSSDLRCSGHES
jgi:trans-AT polyketide synthase/acyltransferase/oxidoreductase domain-containing protein